MTIGNYIKAKLNTWAVNLSEEMIAFEIQKIGYNASEEMTGEIKTDELFYNVIPELILTPNSISEGGFSVSYDKDALVTYYKIIAKRLGKSDLLANDKIRDASNRW